MFERRRARRVSRSDRSGGSHAPIRSRSTVSSAAATQRCIVKPSGRHSESSQPPLPESAPATDAAPTENHIEFADGRRRPLSHGDETRCGRPGTGKPGQRHSQPQSSSTESTITSNPLQPIVCLIRGHIPGRPVLVRGFALSACARCDHTIELGAPMSTRWAVSTTEPRPPRSNRAPRAQSRSPA